MDTKIISTFIKSETDKDLSSKNKQLLTNTVISEINPDLISSYKERLSTPVDLTLITSSEEENGKRYVKLYEGPVFHTVYLLYAQMNKRTMTHIIDEAVAGILEQGQTNLKQKEAEQLAKRLWEVRHFADNQPDIYNIPHEIGDTCIFIYTMNTFWCPLINSVLRYPPAITIEHLKTLGPFCYLLQTYLKKNDTSNVLTVYRGDSLTDEQVQQYTEENTCFQLTSFTSTSIDQAVAEAFSGNTIFIIDLNATNVYDDDIIRAGAFIAKRSRFSDEEEFLLWPMTVFKFDRYELDQEKKKHHIYLKSSLHPVHKKPHKKFISS